MRQPQVGGNGVFYDRRARLGCTVVKRSSTLIIVRPFGVPIDRSQNIHDQTEKVAGDHQKQCDKARPRRRAAATVRRSPPVRRRRSMSPVRRDLRAAIGLAIGAIARRPFPVDGFLSLSWWQMPWPLPLRRRIAGPTMGHHLFKLRKRNLHPFSTPTGGREHPRHRQPPFGKRSPLAKLPGEPRRRWRILLPRGAAWKLYLVLAVWRQSCPRWQKGVLDFLWKYEAGPPTLSATSPGGPGRLSEVIVISGPPQFAVPIPESPIPQDRTAG